MSSVLVPVILVDFLPAEKKGYFEQQHLYQFRHYVSGALSDLNTKKVKIMRDASIRRPYLLILVSVAMLDFKTNTAD